MSVQELKTEFHKLIDEINDEKVLTSLYEIIREYCKRDNSIDIINELSEKQKQRLNESIQQVIDGNTMSHETVKDEIRKWKMK